MRWAVILSTLSACAAPAIADTSAKTNDSGHESPAVSTGPQLESRNGLLVLPNIQVVTPTTSGLRQAPAGAQAAMNIRADGMLQATLGASQMSYLTATRLADGRLVQACSTGEAAALEAVDPHSTTEARHGR